MALVEIKDKFTGELKESHEIKGSLKNWMRESVPSYRDDMPRPPYSAKLNGAEWPHDQHNEKLLDSDNIEIVIEPRDPFTIFVAAIAVLSAGYAYSAISNLPKNQGSAPDGKSIYNPDARGNSVAPNAIIRELAGSMPVFPDVIGEFRRYVDHKEEFSIFLCMGRGHFSVSSQNVFVSESKLIDQGGATINFYSPGQSVASDPVAENWYTSKEVDGIELVTETGSPDGEWEIDVSGNTFLSVRDGEYTHAFPFAVGEYFEITSSPADQYTGFYLVESVGGLYLNNATVSFVERPEGYNARTEIQANSVTLSLTSTLPPVVTRRLILENPQTPAFSADTGVSIEWKGLNGGIKYYGPYKAAPSGEVTRYYEVDVLFFRGLSDVDNDGNETDTTVELEIQYRDVSGYEWTTVSGTTFTEKNYDARAYTVEVDTGSEIEAEFRFRRITKDSDDINISSKVSISRLKAKLYAPTSYEDETVLTIKIDSDQAIARAAENKINIRGHTRKLPTIAELEANSWDLDGVSERGSRSPIRFAGLMLREALGDKADDKVNWDRMQEMEDEAESTGKTLDADFSDESTLWDSIKTMLAPALIEPSIKEGAFYPIKLKSGLSASHMYTPDVMLNEGLQISKKFYDPLEPDGIEVEYFDLESNGNEVVECILPGSSGLRRKRIQLIGATNATLAWRAGMREIRRIHYKPDGYTFDTEMDALNSDYGDIVLLASEVFSSQFASIKAYSGSTVTLDVSEVSFDEDTTYAAIRKPDGRMSGLYEVDNTGVLANQLNLVSPTSLDFTPITDGSGDQSFVAIGSLDQLSKYAIIRDINPSGDGQVSVTAEEYLEEIYADDDNEPS